MSYSSYHKLKVLVVDDFESFRHTLSTMLRNFGVEDIDMADNGPTAIALCSGKKYDLVLADYNLGRGQNGQQMLEALRHDNILTYQTLFILLSAESSRSIIMSAYDYEPDAYLAKPITGKALKQRLDRLLSQRDQMLPAYKAIEENCTPEAIEVLNQQIISGSRNTTLCQKMLGELYLSASDFVLAENVYRKALEVRSIDWAKVGMAKVKKAQGEHDKAKRWLTEIIKQKPLCLMAYDVLAEIYEHENDVGALQNILKMAVEYCPMAILRQERLAYVAQASNDNQTAAIAFRQTVRLGQHSCHNKRENHINFGRTTAEILKDVDSNANDLSREAIKTLGELNLNFQQTEEEEIQTLLVESQVLAGQGNHNKAMETVGVAQDRLDKLGEVENIETELDLAKALKVINQSQKSDELIMSLVGRYSEDQESLEKLDRLMEEPISDKNKNEVDRLNKEGISHYDGKDFKAAIAFFKKAERNFPNHIGIRLNLVQAMEGELRNNKFDKKLLRNAEDILDGVKKKVSFEHQQYARYLQLCDMLNEIS